MTMSWLADRNATTTAASAVGHGLATGSVRPSTRMATASAACNVSAQPRRRPRRVVTRAVLLSSDLDRAEACHTKNRPCEAVHTSSGESDLDVSTEINLWFR